MKKVLARAELALLVAVFAFTPDAQSQRRRTSRRTTNPSRPQPVQAPDLPDEPTVVSTADAFSRDTKVESVVDDHGITWKANPKWRGNPKVLPIQLIGKGYDKDDVPDGGTVTVTTSSPATQTNGSVNYVDDTPP